MPISFPQNTTTLPRREPRSFPRIAIAVLAALFAVQVFSPLRLDMDSVDYLSLAAALAQGKPLEPLGLPLGYPLFVAGLDRLGLASPFAIVLVNCLGIALGLVSTWYLFRARPALSQWVVVFSLLSWTVVRHVALPLPESLFFGISLAAVAVMNAASAELDSGRRVRLLLGALALALVAITLRLAGVALVPAFVFACYRMPVRSSVANEKANRLKWLFGVAMVLVGILTITFLSDSFAKYFAEIKHQLWRLGGLGTVADHGKRIILTLGELVLNLPFGQLQRHQVPFLIAGLAMVLLVAFGLRHRRPRSPSGVYLIGFVTLLVLWPYDAPRLWMPIIPLVIGYLAASTPRFTRSGRWPRAGLAYSFWFAATGLAAVAYTTRVTFAGRDFSNVYGRAGGKAPTERPPLPLDSAYVRRATVVAERYSHR